jgi:DNA polymerase III delta subunit
LKKGFSPDQCAQSINAPPWLIKKIAPLASRYTLPNLTIALGAIARADSLLKNRSLGHESVMSELLENLVP